MILARTRGRAAVGPGRRPGGGIAGVGAGQIAMGGGQAPADTVRTDPSKELRMNRFALVLKALALALVLAGPAHAVEKVDINQADAATLDRVLVNVGEAKAEAIVAHRKANGPFRSAEQLAEVKGIGLKTVENNRDRIVLGNVRAAPKGKTTARAGAAAKAPAKQAPAKGKG